MYRYLMAALAVFFFAIPAYAGGSNHHNSDSNVAVEVFAETDPVFTANNASNYRRSAASAGSVNLTSGGCAGSGGVGVQGLTFGINLGTTWDSAKCNTRADAWHMDAMGHEDAAKMRMCMDDDMALAFSHTDKPCPEGLRKAVARRDYVADSPPE